MGSYLKRINDLFNNESGERTNAELRRWILERVSLLLLPYKMLSIS